MAADESVVSVNVDGISKVVVNQYRPRALGRSPRGRSYPKIGRRTVVLWPYFISPRWLSPALGRCPGSRLDR